MNDRRTIVGRGASAGWLAALQDFVSAIPTDGPLVFVVQPVAPDQPSLMDRLPVDLCARAVRRIADGDPAARAACMSSRRARS